PVKLFEHDSDLRRPVIKRPGVKRLCARLAPTLCGFRLKPFDLLVKARDSALVARRAARLDQNDDGVRVAVETHFDDALRVAGGRALVPEFGARARPEPRLAFGEIGRASCRERVEGGVGVW